MESRIYVPCRRVNQQSQNRPSELLPSRLAIRSAGSSMCSNVLASTNFIRDVGRTAPSSDTDDLGQGRGAVSSRQVDVRTARVFLNIPQLVGPSMKVNARRLNGVLLNPLLPSDRIECFLMSPSLSIIVASLQKEKCGQCHYDSDTANYKQNTLPSIPTFDSLAKSLCRSNLNKRTHACVQYTVSVPYTTPTYGSAQMCKIAGTSSKRVFTRESTFGYSLVMLTPCLDRLSEGTCDWGDQFEHCYDEQSKN